MPAPRRRTATGVCLVGSLLLALLALPLVNTWIRQIRLMIPQIARHDDERTMQAAIHTVYADPGIRAVRQLFALLSDHGRSDFDAAPFKQADDGNSLYDYGRLLLLLRRTGPVAAGSEDAQPRLVREIRRLHAGPPARIHLQRARETMYVALTANGMSPRRAAAAVDHFSIGGYRPVLRELAGRLNETADTWTSQGRIEDAREAWRLIVRLLTDLAADSPLPEVALLTAEPALPETLRALGHERPACGVEEFRRRWHEPRAAERVNILPHTGNLPLAKVEHARVMRSFCAAAVTIVTWPAFAAAVLVWLLVSILSKAPEALQPLRRRSLAGRSIRPVLALLPFTFIVWFVSGDPGRFAWLISYPTLPAGVLLSAWVPLAVKVIARWGEQPPAGFENCWRPRWLLILLALLAGATIVMAVARPVPDESWRPPPAVQRFRILVPTVGIFALSIAAIWSLAEFRHRRRAGLPAGVYARANLAVAAGALLLLSITGVAVLSVNHYRDQRHTRAFVRAAADPLADRLGPDWHKDYFEPARRLLSEKIALNDGLNQ